MFLYVEPSADPLPVVQVHDFFSLLCTTALAIQVGLITILGARDRSISAGALFITLKIQAMVTPVFHHSHSL